MKPYRTIFLEKVFLGRDTDFANADNVIYKCVRLAYKDMLAAGRYYLPNDTDARCRNFTELLEKHQYRFSRNLISDALPLFGEAEIIGSGNKYVTRYGLAQKLVNMTFKNFYICSDYIGRTIDYSSCDCPLDSVILNKLPQIDVVWSKLTKDRYELCQDIISAILHKADLNAELTALGNMAFDFLNW